MNNENGNHVVPMLSIVGRANVGKSTLFNRLVKKRIAIVQDYEGVTRDRKTGLWDLGHYQVTVVDTGGLDLESEDSDIPRQMRQQAEKAITDSDLILFVVDVKAGITVSDREITRNLVRLGRTVILVVNKVDNEQRELQASEFYQLGFLRMVTVSAEHGLGIEDLRAEVMSSLEDLPREPLAVLPRSIRVAVVGKPNVGKSSIINAILGEERVIVSEQPGTTRDAIDTEFLIGDTRYTLVDTAGIRRKGKVTEALEKYCVIMAINSIKRCDVAVIVVDAAEGITDQDMRVAGYVRDEGKALVIAANKWDLRTAELKGYVHFRREVLERLHHIAYAPVVAVSAMTGERIPEILETVTKVYDRATKTLPTPELNRWLQEIMATHPPPRLPTGRAVKFFYTTQVGNFPTRLLIFTNRKIKVHFTYDRFLENQLRQAFDLEGVTVQIIMKARRKAMKRAEANE